MDVRGALKGQYHAALGMLKHTIEQCPEDFWTGDAYPMQFWRVAYHTLFFTHLYLQRNRKAFRPWEKHHEGYEALGPPHRNPKIGEPYTKGQVLEYWEYCDGMVDAAVDGLDLDSQESGFSWYKLPKLDHQINNIRHIQHHAALLSGRLRLASGTDIGWIGFE